MIFKVRLQEKKIRLLPDGTKVPVIIKDWDEEFEAPTKQRARKAARHKYPNSQLFQIGQVWPKRD